MGFLTVPSVLRTACTEAYNAKVTKNIQTWYVSSDLRIWGKGMSLRRQGLGFKFFFVES